MKTHFLIGALLLISVFTYPQNIINSSSTAKKLKNQKIIVALREYPETASDAEIMMIDSINACMKFAMENYWDFNEISNYLPLSEAINYVKNNKEYCYITIDAGNKNSEAMSVLNTNELGIYTPALMTKVTLPYFDIFMNKTTAVYATMQLNKQLEILYNDKIRSAWRSTGYLVNIGPELSNKTLLIPKAFVSPELSADDIKLMYPYKLDICDLGKIENAILIKNPNYAVVFYVPSDFEGRTYNYLVISNIEDGEIYGVADGNKWATRVGIFGGFGEINNKTYLINKKELQQIGNCAR